MAYKKIDFPLPDGAEEIELEIEYSYSYDPGRYSGPPENCYPAEEDCEIELEKEWEEIIRKHYAALANEAIKGIEAKVEQMIADREPGKWVKEDGDVDFDD